MNRNEDGFTIIELIISLGLVMMLSIGVSSLLRSSLDMRVSIGEKNLDNQKASMALESISRDLAHAFVVSRKDIERFGNPRQRNGSTIFSIEKSQNSDAVGMTTMSFRRLKRDSKVSDVVYVRYDVEKDIRTGKTSLRRGVVTKIDYDFKEPPIMESILNDVLRFELEAWRGDQWSKDSWDSSTGEYANAIPSMVKVKITLGDEQTNREFAEVYETVVYIASSFGKKEVRPGLGTIRWDKL